MKNTIKSNQLARTTQKYFNSQKRLVELLTKTKGPIYREDIETVKNIGQIPWTFMVNCLTHREEASTENIRGRAKLLYSSNGTPPSNKISEGMVRAMRKSSTTYRKTIAKEQAELRTELTSMKEVGMIDQQKADNAIDNCIEQMKEDNSIDNNEFRLAESIQSNRNLLVKLKEDLDNDSWRNHNMIVDLHDRITPLEDNNKLKAECKKKPQLLSHWLSAAKRFWHKNSSFRYFIYYIVIWTISTTSLVTYYNW